MPPRSVDAAGKPATDDTKSDIAAKGLLKEKFYEFRDVASITAAEMSRIINQESPYVRALLVPGMQKIMTAANHPFFALHYNPETEKAEYKDPRWGYISEPPSAEQAEAAPPTVGDVTKITDTDGINRSSAKIFLEQNFGHHPLDSTFTAEKISAKINTLGWSTSTLRHRVVNINSIMEEAGHSSFFGSLYLKNKKVHYFSPEESQFQQGSLQGAPIMQPLENTQLTVGDVTKSALGDNQSHATCKAFLQRHFNNDHLVSTLTAEGVSLALNQAYNQKIITATSVKLIAPLMQPIMHAAGHSSFASLRYENDTRQVQYHHPDKGFIVAEELPKRASTSAKPSRSVSSLIRLDTMDKVRETTCKKILLDCFHADRDFDTITIQELAEALNKKSLSQSTNQQRIPALANVLSAAGYPPIAGHLISTDAGVSFFDPITQRFRLPEISSASALSRSTSKKVEPLGIKRSLREIDEDYDDMRSLKLAKRDNFSSESQGGDATYQRPNMDKGQSPPSHSRR